MGPHEGQVALVRGGGDLGTGIAHALHLNGWRVVVLDRPLPTALRLTVSFASAAVAAQGRVVVQRVEATRCDGPRDVGLAWASGRVALWTGAEEALRAAPGITPDVLVDARMRALTAPSTRLADAPLVVGVGPGFEAGVDAHVVIESNRGPRLGAVITRGRAEPHTGVPGAVAGFKSERLILSPCGGAFERASALGDLVEPGDVVGHVEGAPVRAGLSGMIRGLKLSGVRVGAGHKVGDVDPRRDRALLDEMTDKARAVGRGVLEAVAVLRQDTPRGRSQDSSRRAPCT